MILLRIILALFSGFIAALAFPPVGWWPLAFVGYSLLFVLIFTAKTRREAAGLGFLQNFIFFLLLHRWFFSFVPLDWLKINDPTVSTAILLPLVGLVAIIASVGYAIMACYAWTSGRRLQWWKASLLTASIWVIGEYFLAFLGGALFWAPELPLFVPWTTFAIGNLLIVAPKLTALASLGGIWFLTFLLIIISTFAAFSIIIFTQAIGQWRQKIRASVPPLFAVILLFGLWWNAGNVIIAGQRSETDRAETLRLALIQTEAKEENIQNRLSNLLRVATIDGSELILVGEVLHGPLPAITLEKGQTLPIVIGERVETTITGSRENKLVAFRPEPRQVECISDSNVSYCIVKSKNGVIISSLKQVLMPFGEYLPALAHGGLKLFNRDAFLTRFENTRQITTQEDQPFQLEVEGVTVGALACGAFLTAMPRTLLVPEAEIIATPASWQRFHSNQTGLDMMTAFVQLRAIELGRVIAQATHGGQSFVAYPDGTLSRSGIFGDYVFNVEIPRFNNPTLYHRFGDWIVWIAGLGLLGVVIFKRTKRD